MLFGIKQTLGRVVLHSFAALGLTGCVVTVPGKGHTTHHVILGFGIVSVNEPENQAVVTTDAQALGISLSDRPGLRLGLGYSSSTVVSVAAGAEDVRVEVSKSPGGPLIVDTQSAILKQIKTLGGGSDEAHPH